MLLTAFLLGGCLLALGLAMSANTVVENLSNKLKEEIAPGIMESLPEVDGAFSKIRSSSVGVVKDTGIGRDWYVKHNFTASVAGAFHWTSSPLGDTTLSNPTPARLLDESALATFPGPEEAPMAGLVQRRLQLTEGLGNFFLPLEVFQTDQLSASTYKYVAENIRQVVKFIAQIKATNFYAVAPTGTIKPLTVVVSSTDNGAGNETLDMSSAVYGRIRNFLPGMLVDILDATNSYASLLPSNEYALVTAVDYLNKAVTIKSSGGSDWQADLAAGDVIIPYNCGATTTGYGPSGVESWVVESGSPYNISVTTYPQFKSMIAAVSASLTESLLNKYVGSFMEAYGISLDSFLTTGGVVREMLDQVEDLGMFQRQGAAVNAQFGWSDIGYSYNGKKYNWLLSSYCTSGYLYGLKLAEGNLTRYVPPGVPGTGSYKGFEGDVEFMGPFMGANGVFMPTTTSAGRITKVLQAPFRLMEEYAPREIQSIKLTGITELNA